MFCRRCSVSRGIRLIVLDLAEDARTVVHMGPVPGQVVGSLDLLARVAGPPDRCGGKTSSSSFISATASSGDAISLITSGAYRTSESGSWVSRGDLAHKKSHARPWPHGPAAGLLRAQQQVGALLPRRSARVTARRRPRIAPGRPPRPTQWSGPSQRFKMVPRSDGRFRRPARG